MSERVRKLIGGGLILSAAFVAAAAHAVVLTYTVTAPNSAETERFWYSNPITFRLDTDDLGPDAAQNPGGFPGYADVTSADYLPFQNAPFQISRVYFQNYGDPSLGYNAVLWLYSGAPGTSLLSAPSSYFDVSDLLVSQVKHKLVFATGVFQGYDQLSQLLTITVAPAATPGIPEPSTWVEMLIGSATVGMMLRGRKKQPPVRWGKLARSGRFATPAG